MQTVNSSGVAEKVTETNDVTFTSTSATGQFLNSAGNTVTTTMSKNTSSRTFYYKDSTAGTFTLTIGIRGRDSGRTFSASQDIVVSNQTTPIDTTSGSSTATSTGTTTATSTSSDDSFGSDTYVSSHSSQTSLSTIDDRFDFKADAGRKRIAYLNIPLEFRADLSQVPSGAGQASYAWSFGDGTASSNKNAEHTYIFSGDYEVVLNAYVGGNDAVSRTRVRVIQPNVSIVDAKFGEGGFVKISNNSPYEINVGDWTIGNKAKSFLIPKDTIVREKSSVTFPFIFTGDTSSVSLLYPGGNVASSFGNGFAISDIEKQKLVAEMDNKLAILKEKILAMRNGEDLSVLATNEGRKGAPAVAGAPTPIFSPTALPNLVKNTSSKNIKSTSSRSDQTAALINAYDSRNPGFFQNIWNFSARSIGFIKSIFVK